MRRSDESDRCYVRAPDRVVCTDERWFVQTREGLRGPFSTRRAARAEAALFLDTMQHLERRVVPPELERGAAAVGGVPVMDVAVGDKAVSMDATSRR